MTPRETYRELCHEQNISLFSQAWWLDAVVGPNTWDVSLCKNGNAIGGAFAFAKLPIKKVFKGIYTPSLSHRAELFVHPDLLNSGASQEENEVITTLIDGLPKHDLFDMRFHYRMKNWLPFYWKHYRQTTLYSSVIKTTVGTLDQTFNGFEARAKNKIRKAQKEFAVEESDDVETFFRLNQMSFKRHGLPSPYSYAFLKGLDKACKSQNARAILLAKLPNEQVVAGAYLVKDRDYQYYLAAGMDENFKNSGASSLLIWHAIQMAASEQLIFDFEGSMQPSISYYYQSFNPENIPYFRIHKNHHPLLKLVYGK